MQDAGIPIGSEIGGGYFIVDGYRLPPISITEEEANTLVVLEKLIEKQGDKSLLKNFNSLLIKIKATLKNFQKDKVELLSSRTFSLDTNEIVESNWLSEIQKSISNKVTIKITYNSIYKQELTYRNIEPLAICFVNNVWIVIAHCQLRDEVREFRLDRINKLITTSECFETENNFELQEYFKSFKT